MLELLILPMKLETYNLIQTAYILRNAYAHFPKESVHIVSVDSFSTRPQKSFGKMRMGIISLLQTNGLIEPHFLTKTRSHLAEITINNRFDDRSENLPV